MGGGASGSAFGGIGISNFTILSAGVILLGALTAHILTRQEARNNFHRSMMYDDIRAERENKWDSIPEDDKRRMQFHHTGHQDPMNADEAANDLFAFTSSITLPDTALSNHDRIKECIHRQNPRIKAIINSMRDGHMNMQQAHHEIHGLSQNIMQELRLPYRESVNLMPYTIGNVD